MMAGKGYATKNSSRVEMFDAINTVCEGKKFICDTIKTNITNMHRVKDPVSLEILTGRERAIVNMIGARQIIKRDSRQFADLSKDG
ncbi:MAG: hypothetical protein P0Y53_15480 [Candidatus Pseudobacter hemicellulosilyticus]|uniref:Uncharacterized protein n=1 Tax=Candidatus Pseudobacter hemicellulosilyticus TaxID=3121375 RepID=A0AAJ6BFN6_9BACT|nr:MAG: hypothetical protein P0Y53_15480 [Pseudobacter sp.]